VSFAASEAEILRTVDARLDGDQPSAPCLTFGEQACPMSPSQARRSAEMLGILMASYISFCCRLTRTPLRGISTAITTKSRKPREPLFTILPNVPNRTTV
jgi:hypothetical protein